MRDGQSFCDTAKVLPDDKSEGVLLEVNSISILRINRDNSWEGLES